MSLDYENWRGRVRVTRLLPHVWLGPLPQQSQRPS